MHGQEEQQSLLPQNTVPNEDGQDDESQLLDSPDHYMPDNGKRWTTGRILVGILIIIVIVSFLSALTYGLVLEPDLSPKFTNGTHAFHPTVILISLDGTVNRYLDLALTPHISKLAQQGVRAQWMLPSYPSITFPNHWTLVTGLYPESHGVVGNIFYDPVLNDTFNYKSAAQSWDAKWWGGEPIWNTAERQGKRTGVIMWPGCSTVFEHNQKASLIVPFNHSMPLDEKVDQVVDWIDLPIEERPQLIALYVPQVDEAGHVYGPDSNETRDQLQFVDRGVGRLLDQLDQRHLDDIVHVVIVSDHGMSATDMSRLVFYDDELTPDELSLIWRIEAYPNLAIRPQPNVDESEAVDRLYDAFMRLYNRTTDPHFQVYKRDMIPERFHFQHNARIPPLLVMPDPGWILLTHRQFDPSRADHYNPRGVHGYDEESPDSHAIFVARGPYFPTGHTLQPFPNIEVYEVLTEILGITPAKNNGTLHGELAIQN